MKKYKNLDEKVIKRRIINFLLRKGYNYSVIESILPEVL
jgi:SOS response regulatory protein OraA/RecX